MNRRVDQKEASTAKMTIRVTEREREQWKELAEYCTEDISGLIRRLMAEERARVFPGGRRPSKRPQRA